MSLRSIGVQLAAWACAAHLLLGCGNSQPPPPPNHTTDELPQVGSGAGGPDFVGSSGGILGCQPATCEQLGTDCGQLADGCGGALDCGACPDGKACSLLHSNVCSAPNELCVPVTADVACSGKQCGVEGDGCGGSIDCGACSDPQICGLSRPFQCAEPAAGGGSCPERITSCADAGAECGVIGDGCGGTLDCGKCSGAQVCGVDAPWKCGNPPVCQPLEPAAACANKCGLVSNGCGTEVAGGVIDCQALFPCPAGEGCGGGGIPNQCGSSPGGCHPLDRASACANAVCGAASDGCGGSYACGDCPAGEACHAGQCAASACTPLPTALACAGKSCGQVGDGCSDTYTCGVCAAGERCGAQAAFQCGSPSACQPQSADDACAGKACGVVFDGCGTSADHSYDCAQVHGTGGCPSSEACGVRRPFQCDALPQPVCTPSAGSCAALGWQCGLAINNCGQVFDCALEGRSCSAFESCVGGISGPTRCVGGVSDCPLCQAVPSCSANALTRLTGTVLSPGRTDDNTSNQVGVPNAFVYIPRSPRAEDLPAIDTGIPANGTSCDRCSEQDLGPVLASAVTDSFGEYTLEGNIPIGTDFLLVTKVGKFRRAVSLRLPAGAACNTTNFSAALPDNPTRLPRSQSDGLGAHLPEVAVSTGRIDAMECVFEKMGIAHSEFGNPGSSARIQLYRGGPSAAAAAGATIDASTPFDAALYTSLPRLESYDLVVADCEGADWDGANGFVERDASGARVREYVNRGGRLFASHLSFSWLHQNGTAAFSSTAPLATGLAAVASWDTDYLATGNLSNGGTGVVSVGRPAASPRIDNFAAWMMNEGVTDATGVFPITDPRSMALALGPSSEEFVFRQDGNGRVQQFSFDTPYGAPDAARCGRVAYSGFHVAATGGGDSPFANAVFPAHCAGALTDQEKVLLYMLFDLGSCIGDQPVPPACVPRSCPSDGSCGALPDGCGGQLDCGCAGGQTCIQNQCVAPSCIPTTCAAEGVSCSSISDGCGHVLVCECPHCQPLDCTDQDAECGLLGDGCSGIVDCGVCPQGQVCGSNGGKPNQCVGCQPQTCATAGANCGSIGDGCGGSVDCGACAPGQVCGAGAPNQCGAGPACTPRSCAAAQAECGLIGDGCGSTVDCGPCPAGEVCGLERPFHCAAPPPCTPTTCESAGAECGFLSDGCGELLDCGTCGGGASCGVVRANVCAIIH